MAPPKMSSSALPEPEQYSGRNPSLVSNGGSLASLYRLPLHPNAPETIGRGIQRFSQSEQDIFLANTLSDALQLATESVAYFDEDSTNCPTPMTPGRRHVHNSTQSDHQKDSGDSPPSQ
jgi:hypothetical protein